MSIVSAEIAKLTGDPNTEGINLLKDALGDNYQPVSALLQAKGLVALELAIEEETAVKLLGSSEGPEFVTEFNSGTITKAQWLNVAQVVVNLALTDMGLSSTDTLVMGVEAVFGAIAEWVASTKASR